MGASNKQTDKTPDIDIDIILKGGLGDMAKTKEGRESLVPIADQVNAVLKARKGIVGRTAHFLENEALVTGEVTSGLRVAGYILTGVSLVQGAVKGFKWVRDWLAPIG